MSRHARDATRRSKYIPAIQHRRAHDPSRRLQVESTEPKRIEEAFGWAKTIGGMRRTRFRGVPRTTLAATLTFTALNILRIVNLSPPSTA
jgi:IS5 family transposase